MTISFSARSDMGKVRTNNEDNLCCGGLTLTPETRDAPFAASGEADAPCVFAVFDGMGGQEYGEFASYAAAGAAPELERAVRAAPPGEIDALVQDYVTSVNNGICAEIRAKSARIGTTLALVVVTETEIKPYNIGDSRIYALEGGALRRISQEHTLAAQKVRMGVLTEEEARSSRDRHKLTQYLGIFEDEMIVVAEPLPPLPRTESHRLLLCSDGLTDLVSDERMAEILGSGSAEQAVNLLVEEALQNGGKDNVTCVIVDLRPTRPIPQKAPARKRVLAVAAATAVLAAAVLAAAVALYGVHRYGEIEKPDARTYPENDGVTVNEPENRASPDETPTKGEMKPAGDDLRPRPPAEDEIEPPPSSPEGEAERPKAPPVPAEDGGAAPQKSISDSTLDLTEQ
ncbi:MAG: protein phosphatase 2C domain-containing protein [Clostridiales Family XIII bacterium]|jgi:protein phosphatase|nr:protein phosphatase 2C domain-containing protein [Clostridiales Family XIII bacterium]